MSSNMKRADIEESDIELLERDDPMQRMPFLGAASKAVGVSVGSRFFNYGRHFRKIGIFIAVLAVLVFVFDTWGDAFLDWVHADFDDALTPDRDEGQPLHILLPATGKNINLCKTTLGLNILGYPDPTFLGWDRLYDDDNMVDGGARIGSKITQALVYVKSMQNEDDLVLIADGYDTWFQLPPATLRARYFLALDAANYRMRHRLGRRAIRREAMKDHVVFAAGKTCTPNGLHTVACYPIMEPPTSVDMYGNNTDTEIGSTKHSSYRPRYLDAAFMMGRVKDVRAILERAQELIGTLPPTEPVETPYSSALDAAAGPDNQPSAHLYHGSPQSIFARIYGEQEFQREVVRLRYRSWFKKWSLPHTPGSVEGQHFKDLLRPPFPHEKVKRLPGHPREYGIAIDYTGLIGSSTFNAERDLRALKFDGTWQPEELPDRNAYDCRPKIKPTLPNDVVSAPVPKVIADSPGRPWAWSSANKLFGNLCLGNVPVMVHHNGDKTLREQWWGDVWYQSQGREMLQRLDETNPDGVDLTEGRKPGVGGWSDLDQWMGWRELCHAEWDEAIFGSSTK